jgi:phosphate transport system substrate-binding protein
LRALTLDGIEPTESNAAGGRYPIIKTFFFVTAPTLSPYAQQFIAFVRSPAGHDILTQTGHWIP